MSLHEISPAATAASSRPPYAVTVAQDRMGVNARLAELMDPPHKAGITPSQLWRIIVKHSRTLIGCLLVALALGVTATLLTKPIYTAETTLRIDREAEKVVGSEQTTNADSLGDEFFQTEYGMLRSRALAGRVADALGLAKDETFIRQMTGEKASAPGESDTPAERRDFVIDLLQANLVVAPQRGSRLVTLAFNSPVPALSARLVNAFAENFISTAVERRFESTAYARDFLEKRIAQVRGKLEQSERDVVAYATRQQIIPLSGGGGQANGTDTARSLQGSDLEAFNSALSTAKTDRIRAEQRWRQAMASPGLGLPEILQSPTIQELSKDHAKLAAEYRERSNTYKPEYPDMVRLRSKIEELDNQLALEARNIRESLHAQYLSALENERSLGGQVSGLKSQVLDLRGRSIQYTILQREVDTNRSLYDGLLQRYKEVGVAGGVAASNIAIVDRADAPKHPSRPRPAMNLALAGLMGLMLAAVIIFLRETLDQAVRTPADVETRMGLTLLGTVPQLKRNLSPVIALGDARSPMSEAYYSLRSALQFSTTDGFPKTLLITSPMPGGGKSTTTLAISQNLARLGFRVLIIDADLRKPTLHQLTGVDNHAGLSSILIGAVALSEVTHKVDLGNLFVVPSGPLAPNPAELLAGERLHALIAEARHIYDYVIFDGPPIMDLADAPMLGSAVAGCLMVVQGQKNTRGQVVQALRRMAMGQAHVLGVVLTRHTVSRADYGYGYGYSYGGSADQNARGLGKFAAQARRLVSK